MAAAFKPTVSPIAIAAAITCGGGRHRGRQRLSAGVLRVYFRAGGPTRYIGKGGSRNGR